MPCFMLASWGSSLLLFEGQFLLSTSKGMWDSTSEKAWIEHALLHQPVILVPINPISHGLHPGPPLTLRLRNFSGCLHGVGGPLQVGTLPPPPLYKLCKSPKLIQSLHLR